jgi:hypothetical protein
VKVVDAAGVPISGAEVEAVSLSINGGPNLTDMKGEAIVPSNSQETKWVAVRKPGYKYVQVYLPGSWPLRVTLIPEHP